MLRITKISCLVLSLFISSVMADKVRQDVLMEKDVPPVALTRNDDSATEELKVLDEQSHSLLHNYLMRELDRRFSQEQNRREDILQSTASIMAYRQQLREHYAKLIGELPEKTALKPVVTGRLEEDGYVIEKIAFESRPNHHVTANLYLPAEVKRPVPGVLVTCGHARQGKTFSDYQRVCILLAKNGLAALIVDPIGQGERLQMFDENQSPVAPSPVLHHSLLDNGAMLAGCDISIWMLWDNIRAVDYLVSRDEIDAARIGLTGNSGGGTQAAYLMALDNRIGPAAPSCFLSSQHAILHAIGTQDGCQQIPGDTAAGFEHISYILMRTPKPTRVLAAEKDFFPIEATRQSVDYVKKVYDRMGHPESIDLFMANDGHSFSKPRRQAAVQWMKQWLLDDNAPVIEPNDLALRTDAELQVTKTGQAAYSLPNEKTMRDILLKQVTQWTKDRQAFWSTTDHDQRVEKIAKMIGCRTEIGSVQVTHVGQIDRNGYQINKIRLDRPGEPPVPGLLFVPNHPDDQRKAPAVIYLTDKGMTSAAVAEGILEQWTRSGCIVLAIDVRGMGQTADTVHPKRDYGGSANYSVAILSLQLGRPLLGQRVEDVLAAIDAVSNIQGVDPKRIELLGVGNAGPIALHAAFFSDQVCRVSTKDSISSFAEDIIARPQQFDRIDHVVPGVLRLYDLSDIQHSLGKRYVLIPGSVK